MHGRCGSSRGEVYLPGAVGLGQWLGLWFGRVGQPVAHALVGLGQWFGAEQGALFGCGSGGGCQGCCVSKTVSKMGSVGWFSVSRDVGGCRLSG